LGGAKNLFVRIVYSTCLFCHSPLGANDVVEYLPVGRRLAFDAAKGRLWVVCAVCQRWNLTPIEERWEAIEDCERRFRATRLRVSTDNIGLAHIPGEVELVRVGTPLRPELAAWRYGPQFLSRRRRALPRIVADRYTRALNENPLAREVQQVALMAAALAWGWPAVIGAFGTLTLAERLLSRRPKIHLGTKGRAPMVIRARDLASLELATDRDHRWHLTVRHSAGESTLTGIEVPLALGTLLAAVNADGSTQSQVTIAVAKLDHFGDADRFLDFAARRGDRKPGLRHLGAEQQLALEMAVHEEAERRALAGELADLEAAWRVAEEVAAIADDMFLPKSATDFLARHRLGRGAG
jgi:hypothetical protein